MKLHYFHGREPIRVLVMVREQQRLELFIKPLAEQAWGLVVLAGPDQGRPERQQCQGPWKTLAQAESALRRTAGALMGNGYEARPSDYVVWSVTAQRLSRSIRADQSSRATTESVDPDQFEPLV
ncbi:hypothetical protein [Marinobacter apostichopi]|uniref:PA4575 family protein n=1 Tax=Marinobacter apostichopi TaxID=3035454 RepID=UPI00257296EE|nr:hypothetical protein [Marinobacter sp. LA51]